MKRKRKDGRKKNIEEGEKLKRGETEDGEGEKLKMEREGEKLKGGETEEREKESGRKKEF